MPKPIVRKTTGSTNLPPIETQRSLFSTQLAKMASRQQQAFDERSPNGKKMYDAIKDIERYQALTCPDTGLIDNIKLIVNKCSARMKIAVSEFNKVKSTYFSIALISNEEEGKLKSLEDMSKKLLAAGMALSHIGDELAGYAPKIAELEAEAAELEVKVMDDSNLPDSNELQKPSDQAIWNENNVVEEASAFLSSSDPQAIDDSSPTEDDDVYEDDKIETPFKDSPMLWRAHYHYTGKVVAPNKEGAQAMIVMRIKNRIEARNVKVSMDKAIAAVESVDIEISHNMTSGDKKAIDTD